MTLPEQNLDVYSKAAARMILDRFPEWERFASVRLQPDGTHAADFNIPCPSPEAENGLLVTTAEDEMTVAFHREHRHFTNYEDRLDPRHIQTALDFIEAILHERIAALSYYRKGRDAGGGWMEVPSDKPLPRGLSGVDRITRRSWNGTFDDELIVD
jgi:hypothetical protein